MDFIYRLTEHIQLRPVVVGNKYVVQKAFKRSKLNSTDWTDAFNLMVEINSLTADSSSVCKAKLTHLAVEQEKSKLKKSCWFVTQ